MPMTPEAQQAAGRLLRLDTELALPELPIWAMAPQRQDAYPGQPAKVRHAIAALKVHPEAAR